MPLDLPKPILAYFAAEERGDTWALGQCFAADGTVHDEGRAITGPEAIQRWMTVAKVRYRHKAEPLAVTERDGKTIVTAKVSGHFPNSPVTLDHVFGLAGDKIASLEIY